MWKQCLFLIVFCKSIFGQTDYCQISPSHTMCKYKVLGSQCGVPLSAGFSQDEKLQIVGMHNKLRSKVATGQETRGQPGPQGPAADMMELVWDDEVASIAQRWAEQCNFGHDQVRDVSRFKVGQNVFEASDINPGPVNIPQAVNGWYDEVKMFNGKQSDSFKFSSGTGHFTQMVWATTRTIGCGFVSYTSGRFVKKYIVCNYGPTGNFLNTPMFKRGPACSACPSGTSCSLENPGLCSAKGRISMTDPVQSGPLNQPIIPPNEIPLRPVVIQSQPLASPTIVVPSIQPIISSPQTQPPSKFMKPFIPSEPVIFFSTVDNQPFIPIHPDQSVIVNQHPDQAFVVNQHPEQGVVVNQPPNVIHEFVVTPRPIRVEPQIPQFVSRPQPNFVPFVSGGRPHPDMMTFIRPLFNGRIFG